MTEAQGAADDVLPLTRDALDDLFGYVDDAILCLDDRGTVRYASEALRDLLGYDPHAVVGHNVLDFVHPAHHDALLDGLIRWTGRHGAPRGIDLTVRDRRGEWREVRYDTVISPRLGPLGRIVVTLTDADSIDPVGRELRHRALSEDRVVQLASTFLEVPFDDFEKGLDTAVAVLAGLEWVTRVSIWILDDADAGILSVRASWTAPSGAPKVPLSPRVAVRRFRMLEQLARGREVHLNHPEDAPAGWEAEHGILRAAGMRSLLAVPMMANGRFTGVVMIESALETATYDATHTTTVRSAAGILAQAFVRHEAERRLVEQARTDQVTGLGNRWAFDEALERALADLASRRTRGIALALVDLDRFKVVNDSLGHDVGDRLLADVATRLRSAADDQTLVARLGGDELLVLLDDSPGPSDAHWRLATLLDALRPPFVAAGEPLVMTASAGVVHTDDAAIPAGELLRRADVAMYRAKRRGGDGIELDDPDAAPDTTTRLRRESDLRDAIGTPALLVHYQGEWDLETGELVGAEALARWDHPVEGLLAAGEFIPLAEASGFIDRIGHQVLRDACQSAATWSTPDGPPLVLRVNLASAQLRRPDLVHQVADALADASLPPERLCLELTETSLLVDPEGSAARFAQLRDLGVGLAIDDFGTGYSSILQLKRLPLTAMKVDQSFVSGLSESSVDRSIVGATVAMARSLGLDVTAEGVETEAQREVLLELGCTRAQGFLLGRPEPDAAFRARLG